MNLTRREIELVVEELRNLVLPARIQKVFESSSKSLVFQLRIPGQTHHLLISAEDEDTRLHLVDSKPRQPPHPSPFTMQLRKWIQGAWIEEITVQKQDRLVHFDLLAIEPDWEPKTEDEKAPRRALTFVAELLGRHPNLFLVDEQGHVIGVGPGAVLGERSAELETAYQAPPPPPDWADDEDIRSALEDVCPDGTRSQVLDAEFSRTKEENKRRNLDKTLRSELKSRVKSLRRRIGHIESDLERIEDASEYRRRAELLQSAYGKVEPGASAVKVPDFYQEGMPEVEIPVDPSRSLQQNIERYFHEYSRLTDARHKVEQRLLESIDLCEQVQKAREQLEELEEIDELEAFRNRLSNQGLLRSRRKKRGAGSGSQKPLPPYREFKAHSGSKILVGRSARHNDTLTTSVARGRDIWLHARNWAGSHVVLRMRKDEELKSEDLVDAATLAAHFSKGRRNTVVDITYTEAKHVRKPSGAAPGLVTVGGGSTLSVRIEQPRLERLLDGEVAQR